MRGAHIAFAVCVALSGGAASAEFMTGNRLLDLMRSETSSNRMHGLGYVLGVHDALYKVTVCSPNGIAASQVGDVVQQFLESNPQSRHFSADSLVNEALKRTWPCNQNGRSL